MYIQKRVSNLSKDFKKNKEILDCAKKNAIEIFIDEKHSEDNPSFARKKSKLTYEEALDFIEKSKPHFTIYFRNNSYISTTEKDVWEFGVCNISENNYGCIFIFINLEEEEANKVFKKYNLKVE